MTLEPVKFLLVDDIADNLVALEALLRRDGLEILCAHSGREALELLLTHEIALAFLDVQMPEMDGFELAELMRGNARTKNVPIIFVTAGARDQQRAFKGYEAGAVDFIYKPVEPHVLKSKADVFFELHRQRQTLVNALRLSELFVAILGHDLRNPLGAVLTGAQLLERQMQDPSALRTLRRMTSAGQRMANMIDQMLDLTRARLGGGLGMARSRASFDAAQLVQRTIEELQNSHPGRQIVFRTIGNAKCGGDAERLAQLCSNLIANALQHGEAETPVEIEVEAHCDAIEIRVKNKGHIPEALRATLFEPFRDRLNGKVKTNGLGLGLFIAQQIALAHGGRITVESEPEGQVTFKLALPCVTDDPSVEPAQIDGGPVRPESTRNER